MRRFLAELKSRGVLKVATGYLVLCWLILEVGHTLFEIFELPHAALQALFVLLVIGFPTILLASWYWRFAASDAEQAHAQGKAGAGHDGPQLAIVFGAVAIFAIAIAIGVRFFGFGRHGGESPAQQATGSHANDAAHGTSQAAQAFAPPAHSVAVLAFANMSGDPRDEYFSDGLSEELLQALAQIDALKVAARTSSFSFKGSNADIPTVGRKLNVGAVLEGSVRKAGERVRVTAQLISAVTGYHLWSENFDREFKDVIELQSEIAAAVAEALKVKLLGAPGSKLTPGGTLNPKALDAYLRGRAGERIQDEKNLRLAVAALDEAIALDPTYSNAHAMRGDVLAQLAAAYLAEPAEKKRTAADALQSARKAIELAPTSGFAYRKLGRILSATTTDFAATEAAYRRALELDKGSADALISYAGFASRLGRADALRAAERARALDPLSPSTLANLGMVQYYARRHDEARVSFQKAIKGFDNQVTLDWAALNELASGHPAAALPYCERDLSSWNNQFCLAIAYRKLGRTKDASAMLEKLKTALGEGASYQYADIYAQWGDLDHSLDWLSKAVKLQDPGLGDIKADPMLDPVRKRPEFERIVASLNLPD